MQRRRLPWMVLVGLLILCLVSLDATAGKGGGGKPKPPEPDPDPAIAYSAGDQLMVMNADGSNITLVYDGNGADIGRPDWSPDGSQLVFASDVLGNGIYVVDLDGTGLRKVTSTTAYHYGTTPRWSPSAVPGAGGNQPRIAYTDETIPGWNDLYLVNLDGTGRIQVTDTPTLYEASPTWAPSGAKLLLKLLLGAGGADDFYAIYDFASDTYGVHQLQGALQGGSYFQPSWAKTDESRIAFAAGPAGARWGIWVLDLDDPANPVQLFGASDMSVRAPSWSPDDTQIVFMSARIKGGRWLKNHRIEVMSSEDGSSRTSILSRNTAPTWRR